MLKYELRRTCWVTFTQGRAPVIQVNQISQTGRPPRGLKSVGCVGQAQGLSPALDAAERCLRERQAGALLQARCRTQRGKSAQMVTRGNI